MSLLSSPFADSLSGCWFGCPWLNVRQHVWRQITYTNYLNCQSREMQRTSHLITSSKGNPEDGLYKILGLMRCQDEIHYLLLTI
jgi:hypothetical protein